LLEYDQDLSLNFLYGPVNDAKSHHYWCIVYQVYTPINFCPNQRLVADCPETSLGFTTPVANENPKVTSSPISTIANETADQGGKDQSGETVQHVSGYCPHKQPPKLPGFATWTS